MEQKPDLQPATLQLKPFPTANDQINITIVRILGAGFVIVLVGSFVLAWFGKQMPNDLPAVLAAGLLGYLSREYTQKPGSQAAPTVQTGSVDSVNVDTTPAKE